MSVFDEYLLLSESRFQFNIEDHMGCHLLVFMWILFTFLPDIKYDGVIGRIFFHGVFPQGVIFLLIN